MGKLLLEYIEGDNIYTCSVCNCHLTSYKELLSKAFRGRSGKAYLFNHVVNTTCGPKEDKLLLSGLHVICDLFCKNCHTIVGWKYDQAHDEAQKYKEGKCILEKSQLKKAYWTL